MIEIRRLKNVVIFIQTILRFVLSKNIINIYNDIAQEYGKVTVRDFWKYEKLEYKKNKLKLDIEFLNNWKQLGVYPKFLIFKLPNVSKTDLLSIRKTPFEKQKKKYLCRSNQYEPKVRENHKGNGQDYN